MVSGVCYCWSGHTGHYGFGHDHQGFTLTHEAILSIFKDVCAIQIDDDVQFEVVGVADIRETDDYPGIRVSLKANYPPISVPLTVDVTTGDMITPREIEYTF